MNEHVWFVYPRKITNYKKKIEKRNEKKIYKLALDFSDEWHLLSLPICSNGFN